MISSVPYVPPETIKNVAATKGQSVSLATFFFAGEIARAGNWAGKDNVLNFYSRSSLSERSVIFPEQLRSRRIQGWRQHARKKCIRTQNVCGVMRIAESLRDCCSGSVAWALC